MKNATVDLPKPGCGPGWLIRHAKLLLERKTGEQLRSALLEHARPLPEGWTTDTALKALEAAIRMGTMARGVIVLPARDAAQRSEELLQQRLLQLLEAGTPLPKALSGEGPAASDLNAAAATAQPSSQSTADDPADAADRSPEGAGGSVGNEATKAMVESYRRQGDPSREIAGDNQSEEAVSAEADGANNGDTPTPGDRAGNDAIEVNKAATPGGATSHGVESDASDPAADANQSRASEAGTQASQGARGDSADGTKRSADDIRAEVERLSKLDGASYFASAKPLPRRSTSRLLHCNVWLMRPAHAMRQQSQRPLSGSRLQRLIPIESKVAFCSRK